MSGSLAFRIRQRICAVDVRLLRQITLALLREYFSQERWELSIHLVTAPEMANLNERFLGHPGSTDVIAFDYADTVGQASRLSRKAESLSKREATTSTPDAAKLIRDRRDACPTVHGDIFVCLDDAVAQARQFRTTWQSELVRYVIHGLLHLRGYDDRHPAARRKMKREENRRLREITRRFPLAQIGTRTSQRGRKQPAIRAARSAF